MTQPQPSPVFSQDRETTELNAVRNIRRAISSTMTTMPFFGTLASHIRPLKKYDIATMATDGYTALWYNPIWVEQAEEQELKIAICRLVLSCALSHNLRRDERTYGRWQDASVMVTIPLLYAEGIVPENFGWDTSCEKAYDRLPPEKYEEVGSAPGGKQLGDPSQGSFPQLGEIMDAPGTGSQDAVEREKQRQAIREHWQELVQQSLQLAKEQGMTPGTIAELIGQQMTPLIDWREEMRRFLTETSQIEQSWTRPNRRMAALGNYLPGWSRSQSPPIIFAIDTSGSMRPEELAQVWSELKACAEEMDPEYVRIIQCDAEVKTDVTYDTDELPEHLEAFGRGGTAFTPVFQRIADEPDDSPPACLIHFSDLYCSDYPEEEPGYPVLWVATSESSAQDPPWGERLDLPDANAMDLIRR